MMIVMALIVVLNLIVLYFVYQNQNDDSLKQITDFGGKIDSLEKSMERFERIVREDVSKNRLEMTQAMTQFREELNKSMMDSSKVVSKNMMDTATMNKQQLDSFSKQLNTLTQMNEEKLEKIRSVVDGNLKMMQKDNNEKLEKMRETVDEKLHSTLEKRLGESFKIVSESLDKVQTGLGEMKGLASGVGDLKKVLTNVKMRGTWGEVLLGNLLDQILTVDQFDKNVVTRKGSKDSVEFAIRLPGDGENIVYLPIDAKFPKEDFERLQDAHDQSDRDAIESSGKALEARIKLEAKKIREKYIDPPNTTDFAVMYLPIEGLFTEVTRRPGLFDFLQREFRVILAGPTTISALLNSLQMGFRTLVVEKRSSEVWALLSMVKKEFGKFGDILVKTKEKLNQAANNIESAEQRSRAIERKLRKVESLPSAEDPKILITDELIDDEVLI